MVVMAGIQNLFLKMLAVVFAKEESLQQALSGVTIFQLSIQCMQKLYALSLIFPIQTSIEQVLCLYHTDSKDMNEDHLKGKTTFGSSYSGQIDICIKVPYKSISLSYSWEGIMHLSYSSWEEFMHNTPPVMQHDLCFS